MTAEPRPFFPIANEETVRLKVFEAFMRGRVELERQAISGLQELLERAPPLPERKLLWHCALEKLLDGTRDELHSRMKAVERLQGQMQAVGMSIAKAETYICDLGFEVSTFEPTDSADSAQAATATSYKGWSDIKSIDVIVQRGLPSLLSSGRTQKEKEKLENEKRQNAKKAFQKYYEHDLTYRRIVHQQRQGREQFLNSIPNRVQEYGAQYQTVVCDLTTVMESFANYLLDISSTCNSSGSTLWSLTKDIKPLVDANCHTEAIESAYHLSPIQFSPIYYQNPGSKSPSPSDQTILFGCPLELRTVGELKKLPPVLEYLLDSFTRSWKPTSPDFSPAEKSWPLVNKLEQAWTGVEESDRACISELVLQGHALLLSLTYFMSLPKPVLSEGDWAPVPFRSHYSARLLWNAWSQDPIQAAVLQAVLACQSRLYDRYFFLSGMDAALTHKSDLNLSSLLYFLAEYPDIWMPPGSNVQEENQWSGVSQLNFMDTPVLY